MRLSSQQINALATSAYKDAVCKFEASREKYVRNGLKKVNIPKLLEKFQAIQENVVKLGLPEISLDFPYWVGKHPSSLGLKQIVTKQLEADYDANNSMKTLSDFERTIVLASIESNTLAELRVNLQKMEGLIL